MSRPQLFIDNGGHTVKVLYLPASFDRRHLGEATPGRGSDAGRAESASPSPPTTSAPKVLVIPNCIGAAVYAGTGIIGDQLDRLPHYHGLMVRRPVDRGFVVDGGVQARVWECILQQLSIDREEDLDVWITVPFAAPKAVAQLLWLLCTRSFHFGSVTFVSSHLMSLIAYTFGCPAHKNEAAATPRPPSRSLPSRKRGRAKDDAQIFLPTDSSASGTAIVVDVGFSGTTVVPYIDFLPVTSSIVRLDVGGKLLTNRLKEYVSFSQVNVMEDTWLMNHVKERCCFVTAQPLHHLGRDVVLCAGKFSEEVQATLAGSKKATHRSASSLPLDGADSQDSTEPSWRTPCCSVPPALPDAPVRYYLPTIPALLPLGVPESELPSRLPKTSAIGPDQLQHLSLCHERFLIPEVLFTPGDVGMEQQGISQVITEGIFQRGLLQHLPALLRATLLRRVRLYGGTAALPNFCKRVMTEVEAATPVVATVPDDLPGEPAIPVNCKRCSSRSSSPAEVTKSSPPTVTDVPLLPPFFQATAAVLPATALQPLLGAWLLLSAGVGPEVAMQGDLLRLRSIVQQRCTIDLGLPMGRVKAETFQEALARLL